MTITESIDHWEMLESDENDVYDAGSILKGNYRQAKEFLKNFFYTRFGSYSNRIKDHYPTHIVLSFYENLEDESTKKYMIWANTLSRENKEFIEYVEKSGEVDFRDLTR